MTRYAIQWIPLRSWVPGADEDDQPWSPTPDVVQGSLADADEECRASEAAHDGRIRCRAVLLQAEPEDDLGPDELAKCEPAPAPAAARRAS